MLARTIDGRDERPRDDGVPPSREPANRDNQVDGRARLGADDAVDPPKTAVLSNDCVADARLHERFRPPPAELLGRASVRPRGAE